MTAWLPAAPGRPIAAELGVSRHTAYRWIIRFGAEGATGLPDRSSRPRSTPTRTSAERGQAVLNVRRMFRAAQGSGNRYDCVRVATDDHTRIGDAQALPDERAPPRQDPDPCGPLLRRARHPPDRTRHRKRLRLSELDCIPPGRSRSRSTLF
ncbi:leucine zipper domain-containing protein [Arthrobacter sp. NPDC056886]|uniref:leucine zipper domain-containing protein n=1 Tax=Arthrobacter sp. NPDC056886 TaxID=3345960 RepID=UPI0036727D78